MNTNRDQGLLCPPWLGGIALGVAREQPGEGWSNGGAECPLRATTSISEHDVYDSRLRHPCVAKTVSQDKHRCSIGGHLLCRRFSPRLLTMSADQQLARRRARCHRASRSRSHWPPSSLDRRQGRSSQRALRRGVISAGSGIPLGVDRELTQVSLAAILSDSSTRDLSRCGADLIATRESDPRIGSTGSHPLWVCLSSRHRLSFMFMAQRR